MNYKIVSDIAEINLDRWEALVNEHPHGNIFQTPYMFNVFQTAYPDFKPLIIACIDEDNRISGLMLSVIINEYNTFVNKLSARSIVWGGPLILNDDIIVFEKILKEYENQIKGKVIYTQFRNFFDMDFFKSQLLQTGYKFKEHLNFIIDLNKPEEQIWKEIHKNRRNEIRRANKNNTTVTEETNLQTLTACYAILQDVYKKIGLPLAKFHFFKSLIELNDKSKGLKIFVAKNQDEIIGCMLVLVYKNKVFDFYGGSSVRFYRKFPNDLIPWEIFKWAQEHGYEFFDFGGAGSPDKPYGVRDFKKKFGGQVVNFGRFEKIHKPSLYKLGKTSLKFYRFLK